MTITTAAQLYALHGGTLAMRKMARTNMPGIDLARRDLHGSDLYKSNLEGARLQGSAWTPASSCSTSRHSDWTPSRM